jgi:small conductance mechanosensitive channel
MEENANKIDTYFNAFVDWAVRFAPNMILALAVLFIGFWLIKKINLVLKASMDKSGLSHEMASFLGSLLELGMKFIVILVAAGMIGFETSSLVAVLAAAGFAIGLALQGFLGNFASGITIVFFKPYKVGDWVEISEKFGKVESIQIFNTTIVTPGNKTLIIPNGQVTSSIITNFSTKGHIRIELKTTMPYSESFPKVKNIILDTLRKVPGVIQEPAPNIGIESFDGHCITIGIRPCIHPDHYWEVTFQVHEAVKRAFHEHGIQVAYSDGLELGVVGE